MKEHKCVVVHFPALHDRNRPFVQGRHVPRSGLLISGRGFGPGFGADTLTSRYFVRKRGLGAVSIKPGSAAIPGPRPLAGSRISLAETALRTLSQKEHTYVQKFV